MTCRNARLQSHNRCISDFANAPSKFLASLGTSDMPKPLSEIMAEGLTETLKREVKFNTVECAKFRFKATQNPLIIKPRLVNTGGENTCIHIA